MGTRSLLYSLTAVLLLVSPALAQYDSRTIYPGYETSAYNADAPIVPITSKTIDWSKYPGGRCWDTFCSECSHRDCQCRPTLLEALNPFAIFTGRKCILDLVWSRCRHCDGEGCHSKHKHGGHDHDGHNHDHHGHHQDSHGSTRQHPQQQGHPRQVAPHIDPTAPRTIPPNPPQVEQRPATRPPVYTQPRNVIPHGQVIPQQRPRRPNTRPTIPPVQVQPVEPRPLPNELQPLPNGTTPPPPAVEFNGVPSNSSNTSREDATNQRPTQPTLRSRPPVLVQPEPVRVIGEPVPRKKTPGTNGPKNDVPRNEVPPNVIPENIRPKAAGKSSQPTATKQAKPEGEKKSEEPKETEERQQQRTSLREFIFTR